MPVETQSRWCWVSDPNPNNYTLADASRDFTNADGPVLGYPTKSSTPAGDWLRKIFASAGQLRLDLEGGWFGASRRRIFKTGADLGPVARVITSKFEIEGEAGAGDHRFAIRIQIWSRCDRIGVGGGWQVRSETGVSARDTAVRSNTPGLDWSQPERMETR